MCGMGKANWRKRLCLVRGWAVERGCYERRVYSSHRGRRLDMTIVEGPG